MTNSKTLTDTAADLGRTAGEFARDAKGSVEEMGRTAARKIDEARVDAGDSLQAAASTVRAKGRQGSDAIGKVANGVADKLQGTGSYLKEHDLQDAADGLRAFSRNHMAGSLIAAGALGFLVGSALARLTHTCAGGNA